ncbi:hypothetical protein GYA49_06030 [Candidatus Beckwithbacteria bacterium]|nr:hypothetical protein [Candidatus Beckwithbacteria bacterium]
MDQHPIPQNVTQYQFRLIGDMTIKQFAFLGGGIVLAFITTKAPLVPALFRWPLAGLFAGIGAATAFVPMEERSLDVWIVNFFKAIYRPTQFLWQKKPALPDFFSFSTKNTNAPIPDISPADRNKLNSYLESLKQSPQNSIDKFEQQRLNQIQQIQGGGAVLVNSLKTPSQTSVQPPSQFAPRTAQNISRSPTPPAFQTPKPIPATTQTPNPGPKIPPLKPIIPQKKEPQIKQSLVFSQTPPLEPKPVVVEKAEPLSPPINLQSLKPEQPAKPKKSNSPQYLSDVQMPISPDVANVVIGMTLTKDEHLLPGVILEIKNHRDIPVRAVKSNQLSQFFIATPLKNGKYTIEAEHNDYSFDTITIEAKGEIIPPLKIISKEVYQTTTTNNQ